MIPARVLYSVNSNNCLEVMAALERDPSVALEFDRRGRSILMLSVENGWEAEDVKDLLKHCIGPDSDGRFHVSSLFYSVINCNESLSELLRSTGRSLNPFEQAIIACRRKNSDEAVRLVKSHNSIISMCDPYGQGVMHVGIIMHLPMVVECCLSLGASPDLQFLDGPLPMELVDGDYETSRLLLDAGADVDRINRECEVSPLFGAIETDQFDTLTLMLSRGISANGVVPGDGTVLDYCYKSGNEESASILNRFGAHSSDVIDHDRDDEIIW